MREKGPVLLGVALVAVLAIVAAAVLLREDPRELDAVGDDQPLPIVTITASQNSPTPSPSPTATRTTSVVGGVKFTNTPTPRGTSRSTVSGSGTAAYNLKLLCVSEARHRSGKRTPGGATERQARAVAGTKLTYTFVYPSFKSPENDPIVEETKTCTIDTDRTASGAEPRLAVLLGCEGSATVSSGSSPTSAIARSWTPAQLLGGFDHVMKAPKSSNQVGENTRCTLDVVRR